MVSPNKGIPDLGFQVNNVIKSGSALTESTLRRRNKSFFLQNIHQTSIYNAFKGLAEAARQSNGTVTQRICCHLARLKDWNHNDLSPAGGKAMLLPNSVEQKKNVHYRVRI
ncbi:hypothetical protein TNCV_1189811 [Trichonephila clavipes]|nr:hypothetical protein TNCV_1189811 [Trichonephila clavipes]